MAIDTLKKRASSLSFGASHRAVVQPPDNLTSPFDRGASLGSYAQAVPAGEMVCPATITTTLASTVVAHALITAPATVTTTLASTVVANALITAPATVTTALSVSALLPPPPGTSLVTLDIGSGRYLFLEI